MPYIKQDVRPIFKSVYLDSWLAVVPGELNYILTQVIKAYLDKRGCSYQTINDIVGALESAKLEFYRRVAAPYEDKKIQDNGDVY